MSEIFFTSDTHFGHDKEFLYGPRGFDNWLECGEAIVENWNSIVKPGDEVWHLGDMMLTEQNEDQAIEWIESLNGKIHWLIGNHDSSRRIKRILGECPNVDKEVLYANQMKINGYSFYIAHYPTLTCNELDDKDKGMRAMTLDLFGHTHQQMNGFDGHPNMYHVGLDSHDLKPVNIEQIIVDIRNQFKL